MAKEKKASRDKTTDTELTITIPNYDRAGKEAEVVGKLVEEMVPEFLGKIGATGNQFEVAVKYRNP